MQQNRESWSSAPDSRGYDGWSSAPPLTSPGHCHQAYHTLPEDSGALLPILRGYVGWSLAPPLTSSGHCHQAYHTYLGNLELCSLSSEGMTAGALLPRLPHPTRGSWSYPRFLEAHRLELCSPVAALGHHRGATTQVAPGLPLDRSGRRAGAKRPDVHFGQKPACHHPDEPRAGPADLSRRPFGRAMTL